MKISLHNFVEYAETSPLKDYIDDIQLLHNQVGPRVFSTGIYLGKEVFFQYYDLDADEFISVLDYAFTDWFFINYYDNGLTNFAREGLDDDGHYYFYSPHELVDFIQLLKIWQEDSTKVAEIPFQVQRFGDIADIFLFSPGMPANSYVPREALEQQLPPDLYQNIINNIYNVDYEGLWALKEALEAYKDTLPYVPMADIPIVINNEKVYSHCSTGLVNTEPSMGLRAKPGFSQAYLLDYLNYSADGQTFLQRMPGADDLIPVPGDFPSQIMYAMALRHQYNDFTQQPTYLSRQHKPAIQGMTGLLQDRRNKVKALFKSDKQ
jgi:hypothetical protein